MGRLLPPPARRPCWPPLGSAKHELRTLALRYACQGVMNATWSERPRGEREPNLPVWCPSGATRRRCPSGFLSIRRRFGHAASLRPGGLRLLTAWLPPPGCSPGPLPAHQPGYAMPRRLRPIEANRGLAIGGRHPTSSGAGPGSLYLPDHRAPSPVPTKGDLVTRLTVVGPAIGSGQTGLLRHNMLHLQPDGRFSLPHPP